MRALTTRLALLALLAPACDGSPVTDDLTEGIVAGAGYTTFDTTVGGCLDSPNGVNCNNYARKYAVYMSGGPVKAGLSDDWYYFTVLLPGSQNGGFVDGAAGNLSDDYDAWTNRAFHVTDHGIDAYGGTHKTGTSPNGKIIIRLGPYADTTNPGGVYILAICQVGATSPSQCKYDAFRIRHRGQNPPYPVLAGAKYYDANANGRRDVGESGIADWPIAYSDLTSGVFFTGSDGTFSVQVTPDTYHLAEIQAGGTWMQTGNTEDQTSVTGLASATLGADMSYDVTVDWGDTVSGLYFGNLCLGAGGGRTLGFWSNQNGQALFGADDLAAMVALHLRTAAGSDFDPGDYAGFRSWLLSAGATNMAYMLSAQLAAADLNVLNGLVDGGALVYAPGTNSGGGSGFTTMSALIAEADAELALHGLTLSGSPYRVYQGALKNALDRANNNVNFVQPTPATCLAPVFPSF